MQLTKREIEALIGNLVETLNEEVRHHRRLRDVVRRKKESLVGHSGQEIELLLRREREVVTDLATVERDRIALLTEVGQNLGHPTPSRLRIAELVLHARPEDRDELLDLRDEFRDLADEIDGLTAVEPLFTRHQQDHVRLYVSPRRWKDMLTNDLRSGAREESGASSTARRGPG
jgi:flagellar biosynthesis/type III secretory pathway chaperone